MKSEKFLNLWAAALYVTTMTCTQMQFHSDMTEASQLAPGLPLLCFLWLAIIASPNSTQLQFWKANHFIQKLPRAAGSQNLVFSLITCLFQTSLITHLFQTVLGLHQLLRNLCSIYPSPTMAAVSETSAPSSATSTEPCHHNSTHVSRKHCAQLTPLGCIWIQTALPLVPFQPYKPGACKTVYDHENSGCYLDLLSVQAE